MDLNGNGTRDWTARIDGRVSDVLYPADIDLDGDGVENILDPAPMNALISQAARNPAGVPLHLALDGDAGKIQSALFREFGILAVDHSDRHAPAVLEAVRAVFAAMPEAARKRLKSVQVIYAFAGHDRNVNIAAFHRIARALSIGGVASYGAESELGDDVRVGLVGSVAHELGHAFLFDCMSANELGEVGIRFGNWRSALGAEPIRDFLSPSLFRPHPFRALARLAGRNKIEARELIGRSVWRESNVVSEYATTSLHEWFADAFAASFVQRIGSLGRLGPQWQAHLNRPPARQGAFWVNYNNVSKEFRAWLEKRL